MNLRYIFSFSFCLSALMILSLCSRKEQNDDDMLYGQWKTSYGDTITFSRENGKNIVEYNLSMNSLIPARIKHEYMFRSRKLEVRDKLNGQGGFRTCQTFAWQQKGKSFSIQGIEWFPFISSTITYFTFTRL